MGLRAYKLGMEYLIIPRYGLMDLWAYRLMGLELINQLSLGMGLWAHRLGINQLSLGMGLRAWN